MRDCDDPLGIAEGDGRGWPVLIVVVIAILLIAFLDPLGLLFG